MTHIEIAKAYIRAVQTGDQEMLGRLLDPNSFGISLVRTASRASIAA